MEINDLCTLLQVFISYLRYIYIISMIFSLYNALSLLFDFYECKNYIHEAFISSLKITASNQIFPNRF